MISKGDFVDRIVFATNMSFNDNDVDLIDRLSFLYSKHWGIETSYRIKKRSFHAKITSKNYRICLFYFLFSVFYTIYGSLLIFWFGCICRGMLVRGILLHQNILVFSLWPLILEVDSMSTNRLFYSYWLVLNRLRFYFSFRLSFIFA